MVWAGVGCKRVRWWKASAQNPKQTGIHGAHVCLVFRITITACARCCTADRTSPSHVAWRTRREQAHATGWSMYASTLIFLFCADSRVLAQRPDRCHDTPRGFPLHGHASVDGEWVMGRKLPRYSQSTCPMLQSFEHMHDVHASDEYEFKTAGCELAAWDLAAVSTFLAHMAGKSLLFAGDSITGNWWVSFVCMLHQLVPSVEHGQHMRYGTIWCASGRMARCSGASL